MTNVKIIGTGKFMPEKIVTNKDLEKIVDTTDDWILQRTGIKERRISLTQNTADLGAKAAIDALKKSHIEPTSIDLIVVSTMTSNSNMPSTACIIQELIGADKAFCMDISAACSGFIYALSTAEKIIRSGRYKRALIIASEVNSKYIDWSDRTTSVLFGDGAGAIIIEGNNSGDEDFIGEEMKSFGNQGDALTSGISNFQKVLSPKNEISVTPLRMDGRRVFNFTITEVPKNIKKLLSLFQDVNPDVVIAHQANIRIIDIISERIGIDKSKFFINLQNYGNTSSASVIIALDEYLEKRKTNKKQNILLTAFGGGLTIGSLLIRK